MFQPNIPEQSPTASLHQTVQFTAPSPRVLPTNTGQAGCHLTSRALDKREEAGSFLKKFSETESSPALGAVRLRTLIPPQGVALPIPKQTPLNYLKDSVGFVGFFYKFALVLQCIRIINL